MRNAQKSPLAATFGPSLSNFASRARRLVRHSAVWWVFLVLFSGHAQRDRHVLVLYLCVYLSETMAFTCHRDVFSDVVLVHTLVRRNSRCIVPIRAIGCAIWALFGELRSRSGQRRATSCLCGPNSANLGQDRSEHGQTWTILCQGCLSLSQHGPSFAAMGQRWQSTDQTLTDIPG